MHIILRGNLMKCEIGLSRIFRGIMHGHLILFSQTNVTFVGSSTINFGLAGLKITKYRTHFILWNIYIYNCIISPRSCRPHLGTCPTLTLDFASLRQRRAPLRYAEILDSIHEFCVGLEAVGSQRKLHFVQDMAIAWRQVRSVRRVVENLRVEELD